MNTPDPETSCVVIQGPIHDFERMDVSWGDHNKIYSTWHGEGQVQPSRQTDKVIYNKKPPNPGNKNINLQTESSLAGINLAFSMGYEFCIKWRSDYVPLFCDKFFNTLDRDALNFIAWSSHRGGYFVDYFFAGPTALMREIFIYTQEINRNCNSNVFPEKRITDAVFTVKEKHDIKINYLMNHLNEETDCVFIRPGKDFDTSTLVWNKISDWNNDVTRNNQWAIRK